jgi:hypothetical protein
MSLEQTLTTHKSTNCQPEAPQAKSITLINAHKRKEQGHSSHIEQHLDGISVEGAYTHMHQSGKSQGDRRC